MNYSSWDLSQLIQVWWVCSWTEEEKLKLKSGEIFGAGGGRGRTRNGKWSQYIIISGIWLLWGRGLIMIIKPLEGGGAPYREREMLRMKLMPLQQPSLVERTVLSLGDFPAGYKIRGFDRSILPYERYSPAIINRGRKLYQSWDLLFTVNCWYFIFKFI